MSLRRLLDQAGGNGLALRGISRPHVGSHRPLAATFLVALLTRWIKISWFGRSGAAFAVLAPPRVSRLADGLARHRLVDLPPLEHFRAVYFAVTGGGLMIAVRLPAGENWLIAIVIAKVACAAVGGPLVLPFARGFAPAFGARSGAIAAARADRAVITPYVEKGARRCVSR